MGWEGNNLGSRWGIGPLQSLQRSLEGSQRVGRPKGTPEWPLSISKTPCRRPSARECLEGHPSDPFGKYSSNWILLVQIWILINPHPENLNFLFLITNKPEFSFLDSSSDELDVSSSPGLLDSCEKSADAQRSVDDMNPIHKLYSMQDSYFNF